MTRSLALALGLAFLTPTLISADGKVPRLDIVDRAIEYHGGDVYGDSEIRLKMCSKSGCSDLRARVDGGDFDLEATGPGKKGERWVRITNDTVEWTENGRVMPVILERRQELRDWVMARIYFTFLPFRLNDPSVFKEDLGLEEWDGRPLHKVKVSFAPESSTHAQDEYLYWFDPDTGRLEQFAYSYATDDGGLRFRKAFDHRRIGGVRFFDQDNYGVEGPGLSVDRVTPEYVETEMRHVSTIRLSDIQVSRLR